jgi:hypothetical protein
MVRTLCSCGKYFENLVDHLELFSFVDAGAFKHNRKVLNVVPGDFTHSGKLDLLVMSQSRSSNQIDLTLYPALTSGGFGVYDSFLQEVKIHTQYKIQI